MKTFKTKYFVFALIAAILVSFTALSLTGCPGEEEGPEYDIDPALYGTWKNSAESLTAVFSSGGIKWGGTAGSAYDKMPAEKWTAKNGVISAVYQGNSNAVWNYTLVNSGEMELESPNTPAKHTLYKEGSGAAQDFNIAGEYHYVNSANKTTYNWEFKADKTFEISWYKDKSKTGTYSVSGNDVAITLNPDGIVTYPPEVYTASKSGNEVTLTLKDASAVTSMLFSGVLMTASKTLTLSAGKTDVGPEEKTSGFCKYIIVEDGTKRTVTITGLIYSEVTFTATESGYAVITLPSKIENLDVTVIGEEALWLGHSFESPTSGNYLSEWFVFPSGIKKIEKNRVSFTRITIGSNVEITNYGDGTYLSSFASRYNSQFNKQAGTYRNDPTWGWEPLP